MTEKLVKAEIEFDNKKIRFEGPREFVDEMVAKYIVSSNVQAKHTTQQYSTAVQMARGSASEHDIVSEKRPRGHPEIVAVLAFALAEAGMAEFTEAEIRHAYIRAGVRPPKVVAQALRDAKNKYQYVEVAGGRGRYRLTNHGDRVVRFDLPRSRE